MNRREHYLQLLDGTERRRATQRPRPLRLPQRDGPACQGELLLPTASRPGPPKESGRQQPACLPAGLWGPRACFLASSPVCWTPVRAWSLPCPGAPSTRLLLEPSLHPGHHLRSGQPGSSSLPRPQPRPHRPPALRPPRESRCSWGPRVQSLENCTETG